MSFVSEPVSQKQQKTNLKEFVERNAPAGTEWNVAAVTEELFVNAQLNAIPNPSKVSISRYLNGVLRERNNGNSPHFLSNRVVALTNTVARYELMLEASERERTKLEALLEKEKERSKYLEGLLGSIYHSIKDAEVPIHDSDSDEEFDGKD